MADFLVDTDVFVDHLRGATRFNPRSHRINYSVITRAELFAGSSASEEVAVILSPFRELEVDRPIAERAGRLQRESGIRLPDALIAATAIERWRPRFGVIAAWAWVPWLHVTRRV